VSIKIKIRVTSETVVGDVEIQHQRHRTCRVHKVGHQICVVWESSTIWTTKFRRKEYIPRKGKGGISEEGQEILEERDNWTNETTLRGVIHESRTWERNNDDGVSRKDQSHPHS
jgi:hypothetical protein